MRLDPRKLPELKQELFEHPMLADGVGLEMFHVSDEMSDLVAVASRSLESSEESVIFEMSDAPSEQGIVLYDAPIERMVGVENTRPELAPVISRSAFGFIWGAISNRSEVFVAPIWYIPRAAWPTHGPPPSVHSELVMGEERAAVYPVGQDVRREGGAWGVRGFTEQPLLTKDLLTLLTTWALMQQKLAATSTVEADRASQKRIRRSGGTSAPVRLITLRRAQSGNRDSAPTDREYRHRWMVGGHWRNHWMSSTQTHKRMWIAPYVKGPDDAPFLAGDKVYQLKR